jgi:hypothetical protein
VGSENLDALLGKDLVESTSDFLIERWHDFIKVFNHHHIGAESLVD